MSDQFGINVKHFCREHERWLLAQPPSRAALEAHLEKLRWLQHERLVHLIVTVMVVFVELFTVALTVLHPELGLLPPILTLGLAVLLGFYFFHYFFLENTVQHWYRLAEKIMLDLQQRS